MQLTGNIHIYIYIHARKHTQYSLCFFAVVWLWPCPLLVQQSDYCSRSVCALAVMWSLWRLAIVWPKTIFVVAQPLRTGLGQRDQTWEEPRIQKINGHFCPRLLFTVLCVSDSKMVPVWCSFLLFLCYLLSLILFFFPPNKQRCQKKEKKEIMISFGKSFLFELHADVQIVLLPVKLWIAPYWRDVFLFLFLWVHKYIYGGCICF